MCFESGYNTLQVDRVVEGRPDPEQIFMVSSSRELVTARQQKSLTNEKKNLGSSEPGQLILPYRPFWVVRSSVTISGCALQADRQAKTQKEKIQFKV